MKRLITAALAAFFVLIVSGALVHINNNQAVADVTLANPVVKVALERGHGSATHIGNGYYVTAAHVVADKGEITLKDSAGETEKAEVLWYSRKYDIALLRSEMRVQKAGLECRRPAFRENLELRGNPINLEHISTWGRVAGGVKTLENAWHKVLPIDGSIAGGMSGGGVFDLDGDLVGVNVGAMVQPMGLYGTFVGISYIVPADVVCDLMGMSA